MAKPSWVWKETAEIVGVVGVIASLIFVAFEIRQNTNAVQSSTIQALSEQSYDTVRLTIEIPEARDALRAARENRLSEEQQELFDLIISAALRLHQNRYLQARLGVLDETTSLEIGVGGIYRIPYFREFWSKNGSDYSPGFQEYVNRVVLPLSE